MIQAAQIVWHVWHKGHSIDINRYMSKLAMDSSRGWLLKCSCGKKWTR